MFIRGKNSSTDAREFSYREKWDRGIVVFIGIHAAFGSAQRETTSMRSGRRYAVYSKQELPAQVT